MCDVTFLNMTMINISILFMCLKQNREAEFINKVKI